MRREDAAYVTLRGSVLLLLVIAVTGCERTETILYRPKEVKVTELFYSNSPAWSSLATDLDSDGIDELVLAGHRGSQGPGYCRLDGRIPCIWQPLLPAHAADRHHCAAGDFDADSDIDLYCTVGAERGAGVGLNEAWLQTGPMQFEPVGDALGANERNSRGRLTSFLDFNHDAYPDLITIAWGQRDDDAENRSKLWINQKGRLFPSAISLPMAFGARCMIIADLNADGYDDVVGCPANTGLYALLNRDSSSLESVSVGSEKDWYWDTQFSKGKLRESPLLVSSAGQRGSMFLEVTRLSAELDVTKRRRIACRQSSVDGEDAELYCGRLLLHDADNDGYVDILVSRHLGWRHEVVHGDAPDLIIYGPNFLEFSDIPVAQQGAGERLLATGIGVVQINAGESWPGSVLLLEFL